MRIVYPFVATFTEALAALDGWPVEMVNVSSDGEAYYRILADLWHSGEDFVIVEQDMVAPPGAIQSFLDCPREHCGVPYWMALGNWGIWHGVVRYRGSLTRRTPALPESIEHRHWGSLDSAWLNHLRLVCEEDEHWHWPAAKHLTKPRAGLGTTLFIQCPNCGSAFDVEEIGKSPDTLCRECGATTRVQIEERTFTVPIL